MPGPSVGLRPRLGPRLAGGARCILTECSFAALDAPLAWLLPVAFDLERDELIELGIKKKKKRRKDV